MTPPLGAFVSSGLGGFRSSGLGAWAGDDTVEVLGHIRVDLIHGRAGTRLWYDIGLLATDNYAPIGSVDGRLIFRLTLADLYYWTDPLTDDNKQVLLDGVQLGPDAYFDDSVRYPDNLGRVTRVSSRVVEIDYSPQVLDRNPGFNAPGVNNRRNNCGVRFTSSTTAGHELVYNVADDTLTSRVYDAGVFNTNHRIGYGGQTLTSVPGTLPHINEFQSQGSKSGHGGLLGWSNIYVEGVSTSRLEWGGKFDVAASNPLPTAYQIDSGYPQFDWLMSGQVGDVCNLYTSTFSPRSAMTLVASFPISDLHPCRLRADGGGGYDLNFRSITGGLLAAVEWPEDDDPNIGLFDPSTNTVHLKFLDAEPDAQLRCHLEFIRAGA